MRDPVRINRIIEKLRLAWQDQPDTRLCQLVQNIGSRISKTNDIFFVEDDLFEADLTRQMRQEAEENLRQALREITTRTYSDDKACALKSDAVAEIHDIAASALRRFSSLS